MNPALPSSLLPELQGDVVRPGVLGSEAEFYGCYPWALNVFPTIRELRDHLREELRRLPALETAWQRAESLTNVVLLSCALTDTLDDYLLGPRYDFSKLAILPFAGPIVRVANATAGVLTKRSERRLGRLRQWRGRWEAAMGDFLASCVAAAQPGPDVLSPTTASLASLLETELPSDLCRRRPTVPAAFRNQDLSHFDVLALGRTFTERFPDRERRLLVVGFRTAGSYFAPILAAHLKTQGYCRVGSVTVRPKRGASRDEARLLARYASEQSLALVIDEPAFSGSTLAQGVSIVRKAGFPTSNVVALLPVHPTRRDWASGHEFLPLSDICVLTLEPEAYYKHRLLEPPQVERRLEEYFGAWQFAGVRIVAGEMEQRFNAELGRLSEEKFHTRLKRVYEVALRTRSGRVETRYVFAKSVGWGWLGYHAFLAGQRLSPFVPPMLGLRDGILYTEWVPGRTLATAHPDREHLIATLASYVATRVRHLGLTDDPSSDLSRANRHNGLALLGGALSRAYGPMAGSLKGVRIKRRLTRLLTGRPTLIDGKMRAVEWISHRSTLVKSDFEQHGLGKVELNVTDPTYDLAQATLHFRLSPGEEARLLARYLEASGDVNIAERLVLTKLLAGISTMGAATANLADPRLMDRHPEFSRQYLDAWTFLIVQTTRFCASLCRPPKRRRWHAPLVVMDVDGVLDKQVFGFPSTTAAGIRAVSLLHTHDFAVALNTARTLAEVKEYCAAYGFVGGVAEYGAVAWDSLSGQERTLVSPESLDQLARVNRALRSIPGVFVNDDYRYSLRAFTYDRGVTVALPTPLVRSLMLTLRADRLAFHQTFLDTAIVARETDKGRGLLALLELAGLEGAQTIAIGDSEPDLPMFRVATRAFAPAHISCAKTARLLGCRITDRAWQPGLLGAARFIVHPDGSARCSRCEPMEPQGGGLLWEMLNVADQSQMRSLSQALLDPMSLSVFARSE